MKKVLLVAIVLTLAALFVISSNQTVQAKNDGVKLKTFVHYPKAPGRPTPVSQCTTTSDDQVNDYGTAGWHMPQAGVDYKINLASKPRGLTDQNVTSAVQDSFATWSVADGDQIFNYTGTSLIKTPKYDGNNVVLFKSITGSALAITYVWYYPSSGELAEVDTAFNKKYKWSASAPGGDCAGISGTYDIQNIGTHEFGHWVGLDDLYDPADKDLTMYGYGDLNELKKDSLGLGDITGVNSILP